MLKSSLLVSTGTCLFMFSCKVFVFTKRQQYCHVKCALCLIGSVICCLITIDHHTLWIAVKTQMVETSNCSLQHTPIICPTPQRINRTPALHTAQRHWNTLKQYNKLLCKCSLYFCMFWWMAADTLVQGGRWAAEEALQHSDTSQQSAEFDTQTKSRPFLLKAVHWRVKQQTESQCDCLSNEKITALRLTENDLGQKDWVNKMLLLQMGHWQAGACRDTPTANVVVIKQWIKILRSHASDGPSTRPWMGANASKSIPNICNAYTFIIKYFFVCFSERIGYILRCSDTLKQRSCLSSIDVYWIIENMDFLHSIQIH